MKKFFKEFKDFAMRGNVIDLAIGVVIGGAFGTITTSLVNDIIMPFISLSTGGADFTQWKWILKGINKMKKKEEPAPEPAPEPAGPTAEELLGEIRDLLKEGK